MPTKKKEEDKVVDEKVVGDIPEDPSTVIVKKADLEGFLKRLDGLEADNKRLIAVADKGRLQKENEKAIAANGAPLIRTVKITRLDNKKGKMVVAWKVLSNESYIDGNRAVANQKIEVFFQDGKSEEMRILDFYRRQNKETVAEIIKRSLNESSGETELEVELSDGERIVLPIAFVN